MNDFVFTLDRARALDLLLELIWVRDRIQKGFSISDSAIYRRLIKDLKEYISEPTP
jgi:hypothetical protein